MRKPKKIHGSSTGKGSESRHRKLGTGKRSRYPKGRENKSEGRTKKTKEGSIANTRGKKGTMGGQGGKLIQETTEGRRPQEKCLRGYVHKRAGQTVVIGAAWGKRGEKNRDQRGED